jgi:hypothetical protein
LILETGKKEKEMLAGKLKGISFNHAKCKQTQVRNH